MGHGETPRGIYNKIMGIRLFEGKTFLGLSTSGFGMFSKGCGNVQDLVQDVGDGLKWEKEGIGVDWKGASVREKKEYKKGRSVCLPEPCLHLITSICSVFSLKPIFIWFKPECSF